MRQRPQEVATDDEVEAAGRNGSCSASASSSLTDTPRSAALRRGLGDHGGREVDTGDAMTAAGELEREKPVPQPTSSASSLRPEEERGRGCDPTPPFGRRADAVAEVCVETGRPPVPVRRHLLLDGVGVTGPAGAHVLHLLDHFDLHTVGRLQEADPPAVVGRQLFQDADALGPELASVPA
jgi:hypothetical protein